MKGKPYTSRQAGTAIRFANRCQEKNDKNLYEWRLVYAIHKNNRDAEQKRMRDYGDQDD